MANYDLIGSIGIINGEKLSKQKLKKLAGELLLRPNIKSIYEKTDRIKGRLRVAELKFISGEKNTLTEVNESGCRFLLDIRNCYYSPRMGNDRLNVAKVVKGRVLVMFSGIAPYPIVISKNSKAKEIIGIELGKECNKYANINLVRNKVKNIRLIQGDVRKRIDKKLGKFDFIIMARPNLKYSFLKEALRVSRRNTQIYYHAFCAESEIKKEFIKLEKEALACKKKIKVLSYKEIGDIAPYKHRYGVWIKVL